MIPRTVGMGALFLAVAMANENGLPGAGSIVPQASTVAAPQDWTEFKYPERGFAARFPAAPTPQEQVLGEEGNKYTQYMYILEQGEHAYMLCVFEYKPDVVPSPPNPPYFGKFINPSPAATKPPFP